MSDEVPPVDGALNEGLRQMAEALVAISTVEAVLGLIASIAQHALEPVSAVSVSVLIDGRPETWASTSETARSLDNAQYAAGRGPLLSAVRTGTTVEANLLGQPEGWPEIQEPAAERQIRMLRCLPLVEKERVLGALNLYASALTPLDPAEAQLATLLAWHAAFAVSQANRDIAMGGAFQRIDDELRGALLARERVAEAKGILMARGGISSDEAFRILRQASQRSNRKLREVAQELIDAHTSGRSTGGRS
jgi:hypothetical protein